MLLVGQQTPKSGIQRQEADGFVVMWNRMWLHACPGTGESILCSSSTPVPGVQSSSPHAVPQWLAASGNSPVGLMAKQAAKEAELAAVQWRLEGSG
jgi:hypothetical protein